jgi:hypothetical protein
MLYPLSYERRFTSLSLHAKINSLGNYHSRFVAKFSSTRWGSQQNVGHSDV